MLKGAAHGLCIWLIYGIVEFALSIGVPIFSSDNQISSWQWPLIGHVFLVYALAGLLLGAVGGALLRGSGYQAMADLTLVAAFVINLIPGWPLARSENIALLVAVALAAALVAALASEPWQKRTAFLQGPWTVVCLLLAGPWISRELLHDASALVKLAATFAGLAAILAISWFAYRLRSHRPATLTRNALAGAVAAGIVLIVLQVSGKGFQSAPAAARKTPPPNASRPNILLITMDTVRADHTSMYGYERNTTPRLAEFARGATVYTRALATSDFTLPTHASIFTGLYPAWHGAVFAPPAFPLGHPLSGDAVTLADQLRSHGYQTAAVAANRAYLAVPVGTMKGFGNVQAFRPSHPGSMGPPFYMHQGAARILGLVEDTRAFEAISIRASDVNRRAFRILNDLRSDAPFFLFLNYMDAHTPYLPPEPFDTLFPGKNPKFDASIIERLTKTVLNGTPLTAEERNHLVSQYDGGIAYMDSEIANLLNYLRESGLYDNTLIVITSDHGEAFGEHNRLEHAADSVYQDQLHVPLLIKYPRQTAGDQSEILTSQVDLMPTILSLAGCPVPQVMQGKSLQSGGSGIVFAESRPSIQSVQRNILRTVLDGTMKLIASSDGSREVYDLLIDPGEQHNLYGSNIPEIKPLEDRLAKWVSAMPAQDLRGKKLDKATIERLKSLGYVQ
jgi:arylsulfatase A-like enzyme